MRLPFINALHTDNGEIPARPSKAARAFVSPATVPQRKEDEDEDEFGPETPNPSALPKISRLGFFSPAIQSGELKPEYQTPVGRPIVNGVSPDDVMQGQGPSCFLLAPLMSAAQKCPELISAPFANYPDRLSAFVFHGRNGTVTHIRINSQLPMASGQLVYAHGRDPLELWMGLWEKAYYAWTRMGYGGIEATAADVMMALTGCSVRRLSWHAQWPTMRNKLRTSLLASEEIMESTERRLSTPDEFLDAIFQETQQATAGPNLVVATTDGDVDMQTTRLVPGHAYAVLGTSRAEDGSRLIELRNPWGRFEPSDPNGGVNDGRFHLPIEEFYRSFCSIEIGDVSGLTA